MNPVDEARQSPSQSDFDRALLDNVNAAPLPQTTTTAGVSETFDASTTGANTSVSITYASRLGIDRTALQESDLTAQYVADRTDARRRQDPPTRASMTKKVRSYWI